MKLLIQSRLLKSQAKASTIRFLVCVSVLFCIALLPTATTLAQGCGGMAHGGGGGHSGSHDQATVKPSVAPIWMNILRSNSGLHQSVSAMSVPDAVFYGGLLRDDFKSLKSSARSMYLGMEGPLETANNRIKQLTKQIPRDLKAGDQAAATTTLTHLDIEIQRVVALFPQEALPDDVVAKFGESDSVGDESAGEVVESGVPVQSATYVCPMHPEVTATKSGSCPICGMALEKVKN